MLLPALLLAGCGGSAPASVPPAPDVSAGSPDPGARAQAVRASVDHLLDHSRIESIVSGRAGPFTRRVALLAQDLTDPELERLVPAVRSAFAPERLRQDVAATVEREAPDAETVHQLLAWHEEGPMGEVLRMADDHEPEVTLMEYARSLQAAPPDEERADLMVRWVEAQQAGLFYVLMEQALTEAAHTVWKGMRPGAPDFTPLQGAALEARLGQSFNAAVVSSLYRYEPMPDALLREALALWESDEGQWYVGAYALAVAEAIRSAGERAAEALAR